MNKDQIKGRAKEIKGKVKEIAGRTVGNPARRSRRRRRAADRQGSEELRRREEPGRQGALSLAAPNRGRRCQETFPRLP